MMNKALMPRLRLTGHWIPMEGMRHNSKEGLRLESTQGSERIQVASLENLCSEPTQGSKRTLVASLGPYSGTLSCRLHCDTHVCAELYRRIRR